MTELRQPTPALLEQMQQALAARDADGAERIAEVVSVREPGNEDVVGFLIARALARGEGLRALNLARGGVRACPGSARLHFQHGLALAAAGDTPAAVDAFARAGVCDEAMVVAPLWQADCEIELGRPDDALRSRVHALERAERQGQLSPQSRLPPPVRDRIAAAVAAVRQARRAAIEPLLAPLREAHGATAIARIDRAVERLYGGDAPEPVHPLQRPSLLFVPGLPDQAWFERTDFPYLSRLEAATATIRQELLAVLDGDTGMQPYVDMPDTAPAAATWRELNRSPRWSGFHLYRHGERVDANAARCPKTMAVLESLPLMRIDDHAPEILFSVLRPRTHIPPHTGVINGRLTVHLPLIVPENCGALRAGDEQRSWKEGECLVFDDSFVHEAWNDSDQTRVVLILDAWNPELAPPEREALSIAIAGLGRFNRRHGGGDPTRESS